MDGIVFDISRYCLDDGPGIRTTVFLKGCPLRCAWCHNPESNAREVQVGYDAAKCVGCGACVRACPNGCHEVSHGAHAFRRERCVACGACVRACESDALTQMGRRMNVDDVLAVVLRDRTFFRTSGGGMTLSGGEALSQPGFARALLEAARAEGIHTVVETSGFAGEEELLSVAEHTDLFLYDCKVLDAALHREVTGVPVEPILRNLRVLELAGKPVVLRLPLIPGVNDNPGHFAAVAQLADSLANVQELEVLPYHPLGLAKANLLGMHMPYQLATIPDPATVDSWVAAIQEHCSKPVSKSKV